MRQTAYRIRVVPESVETDPLSLSLGEADTGQINVYNSTDEWKLDIQQASSVVIDVARVGGELDPVVWLYDAFGVLVDQAEANESGEVQLEAELTEAGVYSIVVAGSNDASGSTTGDYSILAAVAE